jgi:hypothetical protein
MALLDKPHGGQIGLERVATVHDSGLDPAGAGRARLPLTGWASELIEDRLFGVRRPHRHDFSTSTSYGAAAIPIIRSLVPGRNGVSDDEASAWETEQRELAEGDEFYFACLQFCFTGARPE